MEQAYAEVNEGIWDRLKGMGSGIAAGAKQGIAQLGHKVGGGPAPSSNKSMGQSYAQAQQQSLFLSFENKVKKEIAEFEKDMSKLGQQDLASLRASHPEIEQLIKTYKKLLMDLGAAKGRVTQAMSK